TKYFGTIAIDEASDFEYIDVKYKDKDVNISLSDCNKLGDNLKVCLDIIDKYVEINEIAKKAVLENFPENETVKYYFECHFDILEEEQIFEIFGVETFDKFDIVKTVEKLDYPNLLFGIGKNNEINFSVDYKISKEYSDEILCVKMDAKLNIKKFSHES
ncbi:MAG: DUF2004 domain-containing protein, partial [Spirochaetaceae bacterium]|nr:DUF2004 domain-containing protein [Spirochaetaceae bacterium]